MELKEIAAIIGTVGLPGALLLLERIMGYKQLAALVAAQAAQTAETARLTTVITVLIRTIDLSEADRERVENQMKGRT